MHCSDVNCVAVAHNSPRGVCEGYAGHEWASHPLELMRKSPTETLQQPTAPEHMMLHGCAWGLCEVRPPHSTRLCSAIGPMALA